MSDPIREKLERVRDWLLFQANSEGGIRQEIDDALRLADTEPARPERDEEENQTMEEYIVSWGVDEDPVRFVEGEIEMMDSYEYGGETGEVMRARRAVFETILARLRSGDGPEPIPWDGEWGLAHYQPFEGATITVPAARPSGGEGAPEPNPPRSQEAESDAACEADHRLAGGAPEPDGWDEVRRQLGVLPSIAIAGRAHVARHEVLALLDRLPPEREAEAREPEGMTYAADPWLHMPELYDRVTVRPFDPQKCKTDGSGPPWPVYLGTPGPGREAEIRADERRKVLEELRGAVETKQSMYLRYSPMYRAHETVKIAILSRLTPEGSTDG